METVQIHTPYIKLDSFLKLCGAFDSGGGSRGEIAAGRVLVGGAPCTQRGRKLYPGDTVEYAGVAYRIQAHAD